MASFAINPFKDFTNYTAGGIFDSIEKMAGGDFFYTPDCTNIVSQDVINFSVNLSNNAKNFLFGNEIINYEFNYLFDFTYYHFEEHIIKLIFHIDNNTSTTKYIKTYLPLYDNGDDSGFGYENDTNFSDGGYLDTSLSGAESLGSKLGSFAGAYLSKGSFFGSLVGSIVGITAVDLSTGQEVNAGGIIGTVATSVDNQVASAIGASISQSLGLGSLGAVAISFGIFEGFKEAFEIATGQDNHFGFGGELLGFNDQGQPKYSPAIDFTQGIKDTIATALNDIGISNTLGDEFSDIQYSQLDIDTAMEQSTNSNIADNPSDYGSYDSQYDGTPHSDGGGFDFGGESESDVGDIGDGGMNTGEPHSDGGGMDFGGDVW